MRSLRDRFVAASGAALVVVVTVAGAASAGTQPSAGEHPERTAGDAAVGLAAGIGALGAGGALVVAARRRKE